MDIRRDVALESETPGKHAAASGRENPAAQAGACRAPTVRVSFWAAGIPARGAWSHPSSPLFVRFLVFKRGGIVPPRVVRV